MMRASLIPSFSVFISSFKPTNSRTPSAYPAGRSIHANGPAGLRPSGPTHEIKLGHYPLGALLDGALGRGVPPPQAARPPRPSPLGAGRAGPRGRRAAPGG